MAFKCYNLNENTRKIFSMVISWNTHRNTKETLIILCLVPQKSKKYVHDTMHFCVIIIFYGNQLIVKVLTRSENNGLHTEKTYMIKSLGHITCNVYV